MAQIGRFRIEVPQTALDDLRYRLERVRWPSEIPGVGWARGVPVGYLKRLLDYWLRSYDWRSWEAKLNEFPQFKTQIDGQNIHFLHVTSSQPDAVPLIVTHGWPGSIVEFMDVLGPLADPGGHGGDPSDAFHVVAPSVPGFGFSTPVSEPGWNHERIARAWAELMRRLGYDRYGAHGGDTGSVVSPELGRVAPDHVVPRTSKGSPRPRRPGSQRPRDCGSMGRAMRTSNPHGRRRWPTRSATRRSVSSHGSWRNSRSGPTPPTNCPRVPSTVTSCSPMSRCTG
jgi:hypothetical protein